ncbi:MAG TPA: murein L,D-transpeptidase catalytic domain family protein [Labilithrix sp.]
MRSILPACFSLLMIVGCSVVQPSSDEGEDLTVEGEESDNALTIVDVVQPSLSPDERDAVLARYSGLDPRHLVPTSLLQEAIVMFDVNKDKLDNKAHMTVVDFARHSGKPRFWVLDMASGEVSPYVVAHGSGSDPGDTGIPTRFSNTPDSNMSSLGFYVTGETYDGKHGRSLRLDGVSPTDSNVRARAIVVHGASYVSEGRAKQGRSWGCFALPENEKDHVIDMIQGGSLIYAGRSSSS